MWIYLCIDIAYIDEFVHGTMSTRFISVHSCVL